MLYSNKQNFIRKTHSEKNFENKTYYVLKMTTRKKDGYKKP